MRGTAEATVKLHFLAGRSLTRTLLFQTELRNSDAQVAGFLAKPRILNTYNHVFQLRFLFQEDLNNGGVAHFLAKPRVLTTKNNLLLPHVSKASQKTFRYSSTRTKKQYY